MKQSLLAILLGIMCMPTFAQTENPTSFHARLVAKHKKAAERREAAKAARKDQKVNIFGLRKVNPKSYKMTLDSIIYAVNVESDSPEYSKESYEYNEDGSLNTKTYYSYNSSTKTFTPSSCDLYDGKGSDDKNDIGYMEDWDEENQIWTYGKKEIEEGDDENGTTTTYRLDTSYGPDWYVSEYECYRHIYDALGRLTQYYSEYADYYGDGSLSWSSKYQTDYVYGDGSYTMTATSDTTICQKEEGTLDAQGRITSYSHYTLDNGVLKLNYKGTYVYTGNSRVPSVEEVWETYDEFTNGYRYEYTYQRDDLDPSYLETRWDESTSSWITYSKQIYEYDDQGRILVDAEYDYFDDAWILDDKDVYAYDANGNKILDEDWDGDEDYPEGCIDERDVYEYDANNNLLSETRYYSDEDNNYALYIHRKEVYTYDSYGSLVKYEAWRENDDDASKLDLYESNEIAYTYDMSTPGSSVAGCTTTYPILEAKASVNNYDEEESYRSEAKYYYSATDPESISTPTASTSTSADKAYNLAGQRVDANYKGIVIMNGKKYLNK